MALNALKYNPWDKIFRNHNPTSSFDEAQRKFMVGAYKGEGIHSREEVIRLTGCSAREYDETLALPSTEQRTAEDWTFLRDKFVWAGKEGR